MKAARRLGPPRPYTFRCFARTFDKPWREVSGTVFARSGVPAVPFDVFASSDLVYGCRLEARKAAQ